MNIAFKTDQSDYFIIMEVELNVMLPISSFFLWSQVNPAPATDTFP